jgi:hypothetical protein
MTTTSLTEKEVAITFRLSLPKLRADRARGTGIKFIKMGKSVRYSLDDIYDFMKENKFPKQRAA